MNLTKFKEGIDVIDLLEEVGSSSKEVVKMWKANRNKGYNINKLTPPPSLRLKEIQPTSTILPQPIYHPLTPKQKEKMKEVLDIKYKDLEESKPILEVLENYVMYKKKLDEILIGNERLNKKETRAQSTHCGGQEKNKRNTITYLLPMCRMLTYMRISNLWRGHQYGEKFVKNFARKGALVYQGLLTRRLFDVIVSRIPMRV
ncbi:hypothetical protein Tco_0867471 [Tanacetum coccineum]